MGSSSRSQYSHDESGDIQESCFKALTVAIIIIIIFFFQFQILCWVVDFVICHLVISLLAGDTYNVSRVYVFC
jgi:hypothetical protein